MAVLHHAHVISTIGLITAALVLILAPMAVLYLPIWASLAAVGTVVLMLMVGGEALLLKALVVGALLAGGGVYWRRRRERRAAAGFDQVMPPSTSKAQPKPGQQANRRAA
jgi:hypothetical protein